MTKPLTDRTLRALRAIAAGAEPADFDGRTVNALYRNRLLDRGVVTEEGQRTLKWLANRRLVGDVEAGKTVALRVVPGPTPAEVQAADRERAMVEVCCDIFEAALAAGVLVRGRCGDVYISSGSRWWRISRCPFCPPDKR